MGAIAQHVAGEWLIRPAYHLRLCFQRFESSSTAKVFAPLKADKNAEGVNSGLRDGCREQPRKRRSPRLGKDKGQDLIGLEKRTGDLKGLPVARHLTNAKLRQLLHIQFSVVVQVKPIKLGAHKGHELGPGDFTVFVGIHEEQKLLGLDLPGRNVFITRFFTRFVALAGKSVPATKGDGGAACRST
jgi:hypothetical protein